jgi:hypothetical protein
MIAYYCVRMAGKLSQAGADSPARPAEQNAPGQGKKREMQKNIETVGTKLRSS